MTPRLMISEMLKIWRWKINERRSSNTNSQDGQNYTVPNRNHCEIIRRKYSEKSTEMHNEEKPMPTRLTCRRYLKTRNPIKVKGTYSFLEENVSLHMPPIPFQGWYLMQTHSRSGP